jgi:hypothetical protein
MKNPHGSCVSCAWHTNQRAMDVDGDWSHVWRCWRVSGCPEVRLVTSVSSTEPPACEDHLRETK